MGSIFRSYLEGHAKRGPPQAKLSACLSSNPSQQVPTLDGPQTPPRVYLILIKRFRYRSQAGHAIGLTPCASAATVEHPFGTFKAWMGATHFKTRTLDKVRTEMSLLVLAYNLRRLVAMLGHQSLIEAIRA